MLSEFCILLVLIIYILNCLPSYFTASFSLDISAFLEKIDDPRMGDDKELLEVIRQLDDACKEAGFFYVVTSLVILLQHIANVENSLLLNIICIYGIVSRL